MSTVVFWLAAAPAALIGILLTEVVDLGAWIAPRIVRAASARMPTLELRARYLEEWLAELSAFDGLKLIKLGKAISLWTSSWSVAKIFRSELGTVGVRVYACRVLSSCIWATKVIWEGKSLAKHDHPDVAFIPFVNRFILGPICGDVNLEVGEAVSRPEGGFIIQVNMTVEAEVTDPVAWMDKFTSPIAIAFYDLHLLRRHVSFREVLRNHRRQLSQLKESRRYRTDTSRPPTSS